jgi:hypothetical protein
MFTIDVLDIITPVAEELLIEIDRKRFYPFYKLAEKYAYDNELIVGKETATLMILREPVRSSFLTYNLYSNNGVAHAREIATLIYNNPDSFPDIDISTVRVVTKVPNKVFSIIVDERELIRVSNLLIHRGIYIIDIVVASKFPGFFNKELELQCMSPEQQLIEIYSILMDPSMAGEWPEYLDKESVMRDLVFKNNIHSHRHERIRESSIFPKLISEYASKPGRVIIGDPSRPQIISMYKLEEEEEAIKKIFTEARIESTLNDPKVPTDQRIRKMTLYKIGGRIRHPFVDIYNTAGYSLVSFTKESRHDEIIRVGTIFVIAKHYLVDLWILKLLFKINQIGEEFYNRISGGIINNFISLFRPFDDSKIKTDEIFPISPDNYIGHYEDPDIAIKRQIQREFLESGKIYPPYYPALIEEKETTSEVSIGNDKTK